MSEPVVPIRLDQVSKIFADGTAAVADISLEIEDGAFVSLIGPSGCGKSTLLRLIGGLTQASTGSVSGPAQNPARRPGDIGFVFQDATLMPWASIEKNAALPLELTGLTGDPGQALARVGLTGFESRYPRQLSGGMRMRASIARALITRPKLLLMDEPFGALDEMTREDLNDDLLSLWHEDRMTTVFVTHSVYEAVYLSNRIVIMSPRPGRIFKTVTIDEPHPRGAGFRASPRYGELCRMVSQTLRSAMGRSTEGQSI